MQAQYLDIDGLVQDYSNYVANALELLQSCTKLPICRHQIALCHVTKLESLDDRGNDGI